MDIAHSKIDENMVNNFARCPRVCEFNSLVFVQDLKGMLSEDCVKSPDLRLVTETGEFFSFNVKRISTFSNGSEILPFIGRSLQHISPALHSFFSILPGMASIYTDRTIFITKPCRYFFTIRILEYIWKREQVQGVMI
jgi:hypothetical protein